MADTTFRTILPPTKAHDNGDTTFSVRVQFRSDVTGGVATMIDVFPPLKLMELADGTYAMAVKQV